MNKLEGLCFHTLYQDDLLQTSELRFYCKILQFELCVALPVQICNVVGQPLPLQILEAETYEVEQDPWQEIDRDHKPPSNMRTNPTSQ